MTDGTGAAGKAVPVFFSAGNTLATDKKGGHGPPSMLRVTPVACCGAVPASLRRAHPGFLPSWRCGEGVVESRPPGQRLPGGAGPVPVCPKSRQTAAEQRTPSPSKTRPAKGRKIKIQQVISIR